MQWEQYQFYHTRREHMTNTNFQEGYFLYDFQNLITAMTIKDTMMPVISSYHGATTFGQTSPGNASRPYQPAASPGPSGQDVYNQSPEQSYVQATSPQPSGFQALAINRVCHNSY